MVVVRVVVVVGVAVVVVVVVNVIVGVVVEIVVVVGVVVAVGVVIVVVGVDEVVLRLVVIAESKNILRFVRVLMPSKFFVILKTSQNHFFYNQTWLRIPCSWHWSPLYPELQLHLALLQVLLSQVASHTPFPLQCSFSPFFPSPVEHAHRLHAASQPLQAKYFPQENLSSPLSSIVEQLCFPGVLSLAL